MSKNIIGLFDKAGYRAIDNEFNFFEAPAPYHSQIYITQHQRSYSFQHTELKKYEFTIGEDYYCRVANIRNQLVTFGIHHSVRFSLRYMPLHIVPSSVFLSRRLYQPRKSHSTRPRSLHYPHPTCWPRTNPQTNFRIFIIFTNIQSFLPERHLISNLVSSSRSNTLVLSRTWLNPNVNDCDVLGDLPDFCCFFHTDIVGSRGEAFSLQLIRNYHSIFLLFDRTLRSCDLHAALRQWLLLTTAP